MTFPNPLAADDPLDAATLNPIFNALYDAASEDPGIYHATFYPDEFTVLNGNDVALTLHGSIDEIYGHQSPSAIDDVWQHGAYLGANASYTLKIRVIKTANSGILRFLIDDVEVATFDLYNASDAVTNVQAALSLSTSKWHTFKGVVDSKNGSSSGYDANIIKIYIRD